MYLHDLLDQAAPVREMLRSSGNPESLNVETRLDVSARHVAVARLGADLFAAPSSLAQMAGGATVDLAAQLMVFGSGKTSIDLCASAILRWREVIPKQDREHDFTALRERTDGGEISLAKTEQQWFDKINETPLGKELIRFRHSVIHRIIRQDATVAPGGTNFTTISPSTATAGTEDAYLTLNRAATFVEDRWLEFWQGIVL